MLHHLSPLGVGQRVELDGETCSDQSVLHIPGNLHGSFGIVEGEPYLDRVSDLFPDSATHRLDHTQDMLATVYSDRTAVWMTVKLGGYRYSTPTTECVHDVGWDLHPGTPVLFAFDHRLEFDHAHDDTPANSASNIGAVYQARPMANVYSPSGSPRTHRVRVEGVSMRSLHRKVFALFVGLALAVTAMASAGAQERELTVDGELSPSGVISGFKAPSSALAQTDPALLGRDDATPTAVMIKLDYDAVASYAGTVPGLAPTSPSITGRPLTGATAAERNYDRYIAGREAEAVRQIERRVPETEFGSNHRVVYGGIAAVIPANRVADVLATPGVVAVQEDSLNQPLTDASPEFVNAPPVV